MSRTIYSVESHEQALGIWRQNQLRNAQVLHIDFHCDSRGLLVDLKRHQAYRIWTRFPGLDEGNYLTYAAMEGVVSGVRWVHDEPGGRKDDIKSVKYTSDPSALIHRAALTLARKQAIPFKFEVLRTENWSDIRPGEILDIDWDYFACLDYPVDSISHRVNAFLAREFNHIPEETIVCYSPEYSHPTREQFHKFVNELATRFDAQVVEIPKPVTSKKPSRVKKLLKPVYQPARSLYHTAVLALRRHGIY